MHTIRIDLEDISVEVAFKNIKNIYLRIKPPHGHVRVSAPSHLNRDKILAFVSSRMDWIRKTRQRIISKYQEPLQEYIDHEIHHAWGRPYILSIEEKNIVPEVLIEQNRMVLIVRPGADKDTKKALLEAWYRNQIREKALPLINKWENIMKVRVEKLFIRRMKTRWGTCNVTKQTIRLNTHLAIKPLECLEYIIVHEMTHILEPSHNGRFKGLMDTFLPEWKQFQKMLNQNPLV